METLSEQDVSLRIDRQQQSLLVDRGESSSSALNGMLLVEVGGESVGEYRFQIRLAFFWVFLLGS